MDRTCQRYYCAAWRKDGTSHEDWAIAQTFRNTDAGTRDTFANKIYLALKLRKPTGVIRSSIKIFTNPGSDKIF
ncbi:protein of unknown function [Candidatus Nitrotoga arctica]|uniref:Uncharacterized protein n=1 Tax=Candidatus Nitrotoga arctica TaxID=453162 RepID=A0ABM8Z356_9PROT|nr:protein of unknown function [Candidatus Nitrotoga arctica]